MSTDSTSTPPENGRPPGSTGRGDVPGSSRRRLEKGALGARLSGLPRGERRSPRAVAVAVGLHVLVAALFVRALTFDHGLSRWLNFDGEATPEERITFVAPATTTPVPEVAVRETERPVPRSASPVQMQPDAGPVGAPPPPSTPVAPRDTGSGGTVGNGIGALDPNVRGVRPGYNDERVWRGPVGQGGGGGTGVASGDRADKLDSIMAGMLTAARDSLDSLNRAQGRGQYGRAPGDWTKTDKSGNKWGWDQQGIRLGKVMIPNALLGLLPLNAATAAGMSANPSAMQREARLAAGRADILRMSERSMGEAEFKRIVKEMDKRRDAERRERLRAPSATLAAPLKAEPSKPGDKQ
ncbi:hypothetical protein [Gemmatimonas sp.]